MDTLKYPIGKFIPPQTWNDQMKDEKISLIAAFPSKLAETVRKLKPEQYEWHYRPDGWTIRQVIHHCADSHLNSWIRFKWTLTEDNPTIKAYQEDKWAELADQHAPVEWSLTFLDMLHRKWTFLLTHLEPAEWDKTFVHPEHQRTMSLKTMLGLYAWHCEHHLAHVKQAIEMRY